MNLRIRPYLKTDVQPLLDAVLESQTELSRWLPWCHPEYGFDEAEQWVQSRASAWKNTQEFSFVVIDGSDQILGTCGISRIDRCNGLGELGYWIRSSKSGQGVATEAVKLACQWACAQHDLHRMEIVVSTRNNASQRVAEKAGAELEGILRKRVLLHGQWHDAYLFSILND